MSLYTNEAGCFVIAHFFNGLEEIYPAHKAQNLTDRPDIFWIVDGDTGEVLYLSPAAETATPAIV